MENIVTKIYRKYLYGNISKDEFLEMRYHINRANDEELSEMFETEWNENFVFDSMPKVDKEDVQSKLDFYISCEQNHKRRKRYYQVAAVFLPLLVMFSVFYFMTSKVNETGDFIVEVRAGDKAQLTLPDHSSVWLNSKTKLAYSNETKDTREVTLTGEAFFKVAKNPERPFIVKMNDLKVEVLGTSFNVKANAESDLIETSLVEGSVKLSVDNESEIYYLKPNEKAIYSKSKKSIEIVPADNELEIAWKDNKLIFRSERLIDVIAKLEDWYGVKFVFNCKDIENDLISGTFNDEQFITVLETLKLQYQIKYTIGEKFITISCK